MLTNEFADKFAEEWIGAWNSHNLEEILAHYTDDFEMSSPLIRLIMGESSGKLHGKQNIREYWSKGLARSPQLHFDLITILVGADSITLYYNSSRGLSAEVLFFNAEGKVYQAFAHYALNQD